MSKLVKVSVLKGSFFSIGIILLLINLIGLTLSLRNTDINTDPDTLFSNDITLSSAEFYQALTKTFDSNIALFEHFNKTVNRGIAHYWYEQGTHKYNLHIPLHENYLLYVAGVLMPDIFGMYEFTHYKRAIERGVGLCSQSAIILAELLRERGFDSRIVGLKGHVVTTVAVDDAGEQWWIFDPDFGVSLPFSLAEIERDSRIIVPYYRAQGHHWEVIGRLVKVYESPGNNIKKETGIYGYSANYYYFEMLLYFLKWFLPCLFMLPCILPYTVDRILCVSSRRYNQ